MALSMFLRTPVCTNMAFTKQIMRLATYSATTNSSITMRSLPTVLPIADKAIKSEITPIFNSVRSFRTSAVRMSEEKGHDHAKLWVIEKATSALLVPLIPLGLLIPNKIFDSLLAILITAHSFWGMEALVVEYVRVLLFGPTIPKMAMMGVYFFTALMLGGLFYLNFNDIGLCRAFWKIWRNMKKPTSAYSKSKNYVAKYNPLSFSSFERAWREQFITRGLEAIAVDYVRASIFGPIIPKIAIALVYLISIATLGGLFYIISHDVGLAGAVRRFWAVNSQSQAA